MNRLEDLQREITVMDDLRIELKTHDSEIHKKTVADIVEQIDTVNKRITEILLNLPETNPELTTGL